VEPVRNQLSLQPMDLEALVSDEHPVRAIWGLVERLDLSEYYDEIASRGSNAGRPAIDPKMMLALWIFATSEGVGSARLLERLCERDAPYRWICGGVSVSHKTLSDFRVANGKKLDRLLTQTLAALMKQGVVKLNRVAQDGMKVRASAGAASFKRKQSLKRAAKEAEQQVRRLKRELADDPAAASHRVAAAKERAARARQEAVEAALAEIPLIEEKREAQAKKEGRKTTRKEVRASTTDPECRVMKMADGGFRPAFNVQFATDADGGCIVGVDVTNNGTDQPHVASMLDDIERRTGKLPKDYLVDGGFVSAENIEVMSARCGKVYAPVPQPRTEDVDRYTAKPDDSPAVAGWRRRMRTESAKQIYRQRAAVAERTNADLRGHRGLDRLNVRGLVKVKSVVLLGALTFNLLRMISVGVQL
jgi:transposase